MAGKRFFLLLTLLCCMWQIELGGQNISGIVNSYASVGAINGASIAVNSGTAFTAGDNVLIIQMKGATVVATNNNTFGNISALGSAGTFEFRDVLSVSGNTVTLTSALSNTYSVPSGSVQLIKVPRYCQATI